MLTNFKIVATIPTTDLERAKVFYGETLGLRLTEATTHALRYACGAGTELSVFKRGPSKADHTVAHFEIDDIERTVSELRARGVTFLEYDTPYLKTVGSIADLGTTARGAWMQDPDGNILGLRQAKK